MRAARTLVSLVCALLLTHAAFAQDPPEWSRPTAPFPIVSNIYYVGSEGLASYLIKTSAGLILIDGTLAENVPGIERNIAALGFRLRDIKLLLNTHAHFDHAAGLAQLKRDTGATMIASARERPALETGRPPSDTNYGVIPFPPVKVDRVLREGAAVRLGDVALTPILTPGHTPGCTSWALRISDRGRPRDVLFLCSITVAGNVLIGNRGYPGIVADFRATLAKVRGMTADIVLPGHPESTRIMDRRRRAAAGDADAFLMPGLLATLAADATTAFDTELAKQTAAAKR